MQRHESSLLFELQAKMKDWWKLIDEKGSSKGKPQSVPRALTSFLEENAIVCTEGGKITTWAARYFRVK